MLEFSKCEDYIKNRKFYIRMQCINNSEMIGEDSNRFTNKYKIINYAFSKSARIQYEIGEYVLIEYSGSLNVNFLLCSLIQEGIFYTLI